MDRCIDIHMKGVLRTLGNISENFHNWLIVGADVDDAKNNDNVIHLPILKGDPDVMVVHILPPLQNCTY